MQAKMSVNTGMTQLKSTLSTRSCLCGRLTRTHTRRASASEARWALRGTRGRVGGRGWAVRPLGSFPLGDLSFDPTQLAWEPSLTADSVAPQLFAFSLFPYLAFLYFICRTKETPKLAAIGFCTLLIFVFVTIPAGIYAKKVYGLSLSNVDWLHGGAESFLSMTNLLIVLGFRQGIRSALNNSTSENMKNDES